MTPSVMPGLTSDTCSIDGCDHALLRYGLCNRHYLRLRRTGDPLGSTRKSPAERFWRKVNKDGPIPVAF